MVNTIQIFFRRLRRNFWPQFISSYAKFACHKKVSFTKEIIKERKHKNKQYDIKTEEDVRRTSDKINKTKIKNKEQNTDNNSVRHKITK